MVHWDTACIVNVGKSNQPAEKLSIFYAYSIGRFWVNILAHLLSTYQGKVLLKVGNKSQLLYNSNCEPRLGAQTSLGVVFDFHKITSHVTKHKEKHDIPTRRSGYCPGQESWVLQGMTKTLVGIWWDFHAVLTTRGLPNCHTDNQTINWVDMTINQQSYNDVHESNGPVRFFRCQILQADKSLIMAFGLLLYKEY